MLRCREKRGAGRAAGQPGERGKRERTMAHRGVHFPLTTAQQRRLLFQTWEETGDVAVACQTAHMGRRTFYYWKKRFTVGGYAALEQCGSSVPHRTRRTAADVEAHVITVRQQHPEWGKQRVADELTKGNNWVPLISPATVRRILRDAGLWAVAPEPAKKGGLRA